jgi:hypothetical protein
MHLVVGTNPMRWLLDPTFYRSEPLREVEGFRLCFGFGFFSGKYLQHQISGLSELFRNPQTAEVAKAKWLEGRYCRSRPRIWIGVIIAFLSFMSHTFMNGYSINRLGMRGV